MNHSKLCSIRPATIGARAPAPMFRRAFLRGSLASVTATCFGLSMGCGEGGETAATAPLGTGAPIEATPPMVLRKSASALDSEQIDRFRRAFEYAVAQGLFDVFNDEHYNHHKHQHHGADLQATSPMTVQTSHHPSAGHRLLPWHRAFILEAERMLQAALRARNEVEGRDTAEADLVFIPYWDAAHDQDLPAWVKDFEPRGGTAIVPPDLPEGHAGYGKPVGERYDIEFHRWPGQNIAFDALHRPDQVGRALDQPSFDAFLTAIDVAPEIVTSQVGAALAALEALRLKLPEEESVQVLAAAQQSPPATVEEQTEVTNALLALGYIAAVEALKPEPDAELIALVETVYSLFRFMPHLLMHLWAGGLDPTNAAVRGTVTYFQELAVDPVFWMLHTELDRYWYTWEKSHTDKPTLSGDDAIFRPLDERDGAWYRGGKEYTLDELTAHEGLPYGYDALFTVES